MMRQLILAASISLVAACASEEKPEKETKPAMGSGPSLTVQLAGSQWEIISIRGEAVSPGMGEKSANLVFVDETRASFTGGCNQFTGSYSYAWPEGLSFGDDFAGTRMACPAPLMKQDQALAGALSGAAKILPTDTGKVIVDAEGVELVALRHMPPV